MKRFLVLLFLIFSCVVHADTMNLNWIVDGQTYAQTTCTVGGDLTLPTAPTKYGYTFQGWAGYKQIEYLQSTGTQYIDTGFVPSLITRMEVDLKVDSAAEPVLFGVSDSSGSGKDFHMNFGSPNQPLNIYSWLCRYQVTSGCSSSDNWRFSINNQTKTTRNTVMLDAQNKLASYGTYTKNLATQPLTNPNKTIYLFGVHNVSSSGVESVSRGAMYVYAARIYENGVLVRNFIPVLDSTNTPCMYEKITDTFFYNQGVGDFIAGPEL